VGIKVGRIGTTDKDLPAAGFEIESVAAIGSKKIEVKFNKKVDTSKATIKLSKGLITVNVDKIEFSEDQKSAVITTVTNLTKGEYTVTVSGLASKDLTGKCNVDDVKVAAIKLLSDKAPIQGTVGQSTTAVVAYEVLNQYGEKYNGATIRWTTSLGQHTTTSDGKLTLTSPTFPTFFTPNQVVYLTGVHVESGTVINTQVTIALPATVDSVKFKGIYDVQEGKFVNLPAGFADGRYKLLFETYDQYGNKIAPNNINTTDIAFTSFNPLVVTVDTLTTETVDGVVYNAINIVRGSYVSNGGSVTVQAISAYSGKSASYVFEVPAVATIKTFNMSAPAVLVAEGEKVEIPFTALDQFGNEITKYDTLQAAVNNGTLKFMPSENIGFEKNKDGSAKLVYTAPNNVATQNYDYPVYISSVVLGGNISNINFSIKDKAVASVVVGVEGVTLNLVEGATTKIEPKNVKVQDQYGRTFLWKDYQGNKNSLTLVSSNTNAVAVAGTGSTAFTLTAGSKGTATLTFKIGDADSSKYSVTANTVKANEVVSYDVADVPLMKAGTEKKLSVTGKLSNGASVVLNTAVAVKKVLSTNTNVVTVGANDLTKLVAVGQVDPNKKDATAAVVVTIEGPKGQPVIITKEVKVSYQESYAVSVSVDSEIYVDDFDDETLLAKFKVVDQYGEEITENKGVIVKMNETETSVVVTLITPNGKSATTTARKTN